MYEISIINLDQTGALYAHLMGSKIALAQSLATFNAIGTEAFLATPQCFQYQGVATGYLLIAFVCLLCPATCDHIGMDAITFIEISSNRTTSTSTSTSANNNNNSDMNITSTRLPLL